MLSPNHRVKAVFTKTRGEDHKCTFQYLTATTARCPLQRTQNLFFFASPSPQASAWALCYFAALQCVQRASSSSWSVCAVNDSLVHSTSAFRDRFLEFRSPQSDVTNCGIFGAKHPIPTCYMPQDCILVLSLTSDASTHIESCSLVFGCLFSSFPGSSFLSQLAHPESAGRRAPADLRRIPNFLSQNYGHDS